MRNLINWIIESIVGLDRMSDYRVWRVSYALAESGEIANADFFDDEEALEFFLNKKRDVKYQTLSLMRVTINLHKGYATEE